MKHKLGLLSEDRSAAKGYRVTLYSDSLRATSLYAIYINSLNQGCPKGQCEYDHYTLVFDSMELGAYIDGDMFMNHITCDGYLTTYKEENYSSKWSGSYPQSGLFCNGLCRQLILMCGVKS